MSSDPPPSISTAHELEALHRISDRLTATDDDSLEKVLEKLLPGLLPLADQSGLRDTVLALVEGLTRRCKALRTRLPCATIISQVIVPAQQEPPTASSDSAPKLSSALGIGLVNTALSLETGEEIRAEACAVAIIEALTRLVASEGFNPTSLQATSLLHYATDLLEPLARRFGGAGSGGRPPVDPRVVALLCDFLVDMCLVVSGTTKVSAGSVAPGLSPRRVDRALQRGSSSSGSEGGWEGAPLMALRRRVLAFIDLDNTGLVSAHHAVLISCILLHQDTDSEIARQALFRLNGCRTRIRNALDAAAAVGTDSATQEVRDNISITLQYLFEICGDANITSTMSAFAALRASPWATTSSVPRSSLKPSIRAEILRWIARDASEHLRSPSSSSAAACIACVSSVLLKGRHLLQQGVGEAEDGAALSAPKLRLALVLVVDSCLTVTPSKQLLSMAPSSPAAFPSLCSELIALGIKSLELSPPLSPAGSQPSLSNLTDDHSMDARKYSYRIIERVARCFESSSIEDLSIIKLLFHYMSIEDERIAMDLFSALGAFRLSLESSQAARPGSNTTPGAAASLEPLLRRSRLSVAPKERVIALGWSRSLFQWNSFVIETLVTLSDDSSPVVEEAVLREFEGLRDFIASADPGTLCSVLTTFSSFVSKAFRDLSAFASTKKAISLRNFFEISATISVAINCALQILGFSESVPFLSSTEAKKSGNAKLIDDFWIRCNWVELFDRFQRSDESTIDHKISSLISSLRSSASKIALELFSSCETLSVLISASNVSSEADRNNCYRLTAAEFLAQMIYYSVLLGGAIRMPDFDSILASLLSSLHNFDFESQTLVSKSVAMLHCYRNQSSGISLDLVRSLHHKIKSSLGGDGVEVDNIRAKSVCGAVKCLGAFVELRLRDWTVHDSAASSAFDRLLDHLDFISSCISSDGIGDAAADRNVHCLCDIMTASNDVLSALLDYPNLNVFNASLLERKGYILNKLKEFSSLNRYPEASRNTDVIVRLQASSIRFLGRFITFLFIQTGDRGAVESDTEKNIDIAAFSLRNIYQRFEFAEHIVRLLMVSDFSGTSSERLLCFSEELVFSNPSVRVSKSDLKAAIGTVAVTILVLLKHYLFVMKYEPETNHQSLGILVPSDVKLKLTFDFLKRCVGLFLRLLGSLERVSEDRDPFVQDICCTGLCFAYDVAEFVPLDDSGRTGVNSRAAIGDHVIAAITRDRKVSAPPGIATAGEAGDRSGQAAEEGEAGSEGANGDALAEAAARVAAEMGLSAAEREFLRNQAATVATAVNENGTAPRVPTTLQRERAAAAEGDYGVYTKAARVAKKSGDPAVVFAVLALIQRDPTFGAVGVAPSSEMFQLIKRFQLTYRPPIAKIDQTKAKTLIPMLFTSRFDPSTAVRDVMKLLWDEIVPSKDRTALISSLSHEIINFCVSLTASRAWRDREAACGALEVMISQQRWSDVFPHLSDLWFSGMQVLDDVRDSTRLAAVGFTKALATQIVRACTPSDDLSVSQLQRGTVTDQPADQARFRDINGCGPDETMDIIVPILLEKGLVASSLEGRGFSLGVLIQIVKLGRSALRGHLVHISSVLVESMAALEPRTLQYMQFHTARLNISDKELEDMRLQLSQNSPMQEALDICLQSLSPEYYSEVVYKMADQLRAGVGLATRVAAVRSLLFIFETYGVELRVQKQDKLPAYVSNALISALTSTGLASQGLKSAMLSCLGVVSLYVDADMLSRQCLAFISQHMDRSMEQYDVDETLTVSECILSIIKKAGDRIDDTETWNSVLSCSYLGCYYSDETVKSSWKAVWGEALVHSGCGSKQAALLRIISDVSEQIVKLLGSLSWVQRTSGLAALNDVSSLVSEDSFGPSLYNLLEAVLLNIKPRIWSGQQNVIETLILVLERYTNIYDFSDWMVPDEEAEVVLDSKDTDEGASDNQPISAVVRYVRLDKLLKKSDLLAGLKRKLNSDTSASSTQADPNSPRISVPALFRLLLRESKRGDKDYRFFAMKSLSEMRFCWDHVSREKPELFMDIIDELMSLAEIPIAVSDDSSAVELTSPAKETNPELPAATAQPPIVRAPKTTPAQRAAAAAQQTNNMFGDRYSKSFAKASTPTVPRVTVTRRAVTTLPAPVAPTASTQSPHPSPVSGAQSVPEQSTITAGHTANNAPSSEPAGTIAPSNSNDPAFRLKALECVLHGWPLDRKGIDSFGDRVEHAGKRIVSWVFRSSVNEVWSLKRVGLLLLGTILSHSYSNQRENTLRAIPFIRSSFSGNLKHTPVREACLIALRTLCSSQNSSCIATLNSEASAADVRVLFVTAASDSSPVVLEELQRFRVAWAAVRQASNSNLSS